MDFVRVYQTGTDGANWPYRTRENAAVPFHVKLGGDPSDTWMKARPLIVVAARLGFGRDGKGTKWIKPER